MSKKLNEAVKAKYEEQVCLHEGTWAACLFSVWLNQKWSRLSQLKVDELNSKVSAQKVGSCSAVTSTS